METISPVVIEAYKRQTISINRYFDDTEYLADLDNWSEDEVDSLRKVIGEMSLIIRGMLIGHESAETGRCRLCDIPWPCTITEQVYASVKDPEKVFYTILKQVIKRG
jgi:hypothetical protein